MSKLSIVNNVGSENETSKRFNFIYNKGSVKKNMSLDYNRPSIEQRQSTATMVFKSQYNTSSSQKSPFFRFPIELAEELNTFNACNQQHVYVG